MNLIGTKDRKAISAVSSLAEQQGADILLNAQQIAELRSISPFFVGKVTKLEDVLPEWL